MMTENAQANPRRTDRLVSMPAGRETLLYDPTTDVVYILNATAGVVWHLCDSQHAPADIAASLYDGFSFPESDSNVLADVQKVLEQLEVDGLISR